MRYDTELWSAFMRTWMSVERQVSVDAWTSRPSISKRTGVREMTRHMHRFPIFFVAFLGFGLGYATSVNAEPNEISECDVLIEINATDEDAGWQGILDGSPWKLAQVLGPNGHDDGKDHGAPKKTYLLVNAVGPARKQGMTEYRWESAEPTFDEFSLEEFLERFPAGVYLCRVRFLSGHPRWATEEDELTHCLPDGPVIFPPADPLPAGMDWTVMWSPVTTQYTQGGPGAGEPLDECEDEDELVKYTVTVDLENDVGKSMTFDVPPQVGPGDAQLSPQSAVIPGDFLECGLSGKVEIGAVLESGNATFREREIATDDCD